MLRSAAAAAALVLSLGLAGTASAGVYSDDLSKCLVRSATASDQTGFMVWLFDAMASHPAVKALSNVTDAQRKDATRQAAQLMQRLITVDCRTESIQAVKYEGEQGLTQSFSVLGQVAMRGLMTDPTVAANFAGLTEYVDKGALESVLGQAGVATKPAPAK